MKKHNKSKIVSAHNNGTLVRLFRNKLEDGWAQGYVSAIGDDFFLVNIVDSSIRYDGHNCFRFKDITDCESPDPHFEFIEKVLKKRKLKNPIIRDLDLSSLQCLIESAAKQFELLTLHLEKTDPRICYIGKLRSVNARYVSLLEVTPDGTWKAKPRRFELSKVTRVDFGGGYEEALLLVAGAAVNSSRHKTAKQSG